MTTSTTPAGFTLRPAGRHDAAFLAEMLLAAVNWKPGEPGLTRAEVLADPRLARYVAQWPREDDLGVVAVDGRGEPVGAVWLRRFTAEEPGYGFVAADVPELSIGVVPSWRGRGVGRALLREATRLAGERGTRQVSLSVARDNPARRLYLSEGFVLVDSGEADTMVKRLDGAADAGAAARALADATSAAGAEPAGRRLHRLAVELAAMAQNGLTYATDRYDIARYERLRTVSAELFAMLDGGDVAALRAALAAEQGHATPKVDVRGALFDEAGRVLLVREKRDGGWTLPGGWADALDLPSAAVEREFAEEAGLTVRAARLAAVHDGFRQNAHPPGPWHIYKLLFLVERTDEAEPVAGLDGETTDVGFFDLDDLPPLSTRRTTVEQLRLLRDRHLDPTLPAAFD